MDTTINLRFLSGVIIGAVLAAVITASFFKAEEERAFEEKNRVMYECLDMTENSLWCVENILKG